MDIPVRKGEHYLVLVQHSTADIMMANATLMQMGFRNVGFPTLSRLATMGVTTTNDNVYIEADYAGDATAINSDGGAAQGITILGVVPVKAPMHWAPYAEAAAVLLVGGVAAWWRFGRKRR